MGLEPGGFFSAHLSKSGTFAECLENTGHPIADFYVFGISGE
jgi:hypothetical protein